MQLNVAGVVADGTSPVTATRARTDVVVYQGEDTTVVATTTGANGAAYTLVGSTATLVIKDKLLPAQGTPSVTKTYSGTIATNTATFTIPGTDLKALSLQGYWWVIYVTSGTGKKDYVMLDSLITINPSVGA